MSRHVILFLQDNATPHKAVIMLQKLVETPGLFTRYGPFTLLFPNLKKHLKGRQFLGGEEATLAADGAKEFFVDGLKKLGQRSHDCVWSSGRNVYS
jgi:hypothetical protein